MLQQMLSERVLQGGPEPGEVESRGHEAGGGPLLAASSGGVPEHHSIAGVQGRGRAFAHSAKSVEDPCLGP